MLAIPAKVLLVLHAASAVVLIGSVTHHGILAIQRLRGRAVNNRLQRLYRRVSSWAFLITFALGLLTYPPFRVDVRAGYMDAQAPLAVGFFEVKESWLALGLLIVWVLTALDYPAAAPARGAGQARAGLASWLAIALVLIVWLAFFTGLSVTAVRPV